jgi:type IV pilus assembly protein PilB
MATREHDDTLGEELVKQDIITREELDAAHARERSSGTPWYRQLIQMKKIPLGSLEDMLRYEFYPKSKRQEDESLGSTLVKMRAVTQEQLVRALDDQKRTGRLLGSILLDNGVITPHIRDSALSRLHGLEYAELEKTPSQPEALRAVPEAMARRNRMIPVRLEGDKLTVLIDSPQTHTLLKDVGVMLGKRINPILTTVDDIRAEIGHRYSGRATGKARKVKEAVMPQRPAAPAKSEQPVKPERLVKKKRHGEEDVVALADTAVTSNDTVRFEQIVRDASGVPVITLVQRIIEGAVKSGATDIHLDPQEPEMRVRYRIDGVLHDILSIPRETELAVISRVKIMADVDITETRHPQDGHMDMEIDGQEYDIRVATLPTFLGERIVLRLLDQSSVLSGIKDLGLESDDEKKLRHLIDQPYGMLLVTGPTGSGKTTTLYAALNHKNILTDSIVTIEDPVEYQLSGINQVQVDPDIGVTFASTLRASLRQDIDVLLVGEIRDPETAQIAIRAAMTGHLVFSTLHTNYATEAISTLRNMGVPSFLIASALTGVVAQRLVRQICPECKTTYAPSAGLLKSLGLPPSVKRLYRGKGCANCYGTGTRGRTGIFEVFDITPAIRKMIVEDEPVEKITKTVKMKTMGDRCREKVKQGIVAAEEYLRVVRA